MLKAMHYLREASHRRPLALRLLGAILLVSSLITLVGLALHLAAMYQRGVAGIDQRQTGVQHAILPTLGLALWNVDGEQVALVLKSLGQLDNVVIAEVEWQNPAHYPMQRANGVASPQPVERWYRYPITYQGQTLGRLSLGLTMAPIREEIKRQALSIALVQTGKTLLVSMLILVLVYMLYTRHLDTITRFARQIQLGNLDDALRLSRQPSRRPDELDNLVDAINQMRQQLRQDIAGREAREQALRAAQEASLLAQQKQIAQASELRAKSELVAAISHEMRTPMNGVLGMLQLLRETPLNDSQRRYLDVMESCGETLVGVVNDVLDHAKLEAGQLTLERRHFGLDELLEHSAGLFTDSLREKPVSLIATLAPGADTRALGDPRRLQQILLNLLGNAVRFTDTGLITVLLNTHRAGDTLWLEGRVADTGIGVPSQAREQLFEPFVQAHAGLRPGGTGLGLTITRLLCRLMGGDITVSDNHPQGTVFSFRLALATSPPQTEYVPALRGWPLLLATQEALAAPITHCLERQGAKTTLLHVSPTDRFSTPGLHGLLLDTRLPGAAELAARAREHDLPVVWLQAHGQAPTAPSGAAVCGPVFTGSGLALALGALQKQDHAPGLDQPLRHFRVLAAEDNPVNRLVIQQLLTSLGAHTVLVDNGEAALEAVKQDFFDAVLMDLEMPVMDGYQATRKIREWELINERTPLPILALSAHVQSESRDRALEAGMTGYLTKPLRRELLVEALTRAG